MEQITPDEKLVVRYLLGQLPEEEQQRLEERAFTDQEYLRNVLAVERDLIDEYVRGELSAVERQQFEKLFLASPERRRKVEFARALTSLVSEAPQPEKAGRPAEPGASWLDSLVAFLLGSNPALKISLAAASLFFVIGGLWLITGNLRMRAQIAGLEAERRERQERLEALENQVAGALARGDELAAQLRQERSRESARQLQREQSESRPTVFSLALLPGLSRGAADRPTLVLSRSARLARLDVGLEPGDEYDRFRAELRTRDGQEIFTQNNLKVRRAGQTVTLDLPAAILDPGEYELALKGVTAQGTVEEIGYYYFTVIRK
ncbi:MAG: hypothetical protein IPM66_07145 [Acidobacteriota bacterium]|nr:MAG: hypothetical protein IPM66_07145 [Acidobacteriota bacterium]